MSTIEIDKIAVNLDQQSTLAKLLAQENITVIHGNYRTGWFDPTRRVLALPIWKNRGKAVYDLLTGHEVGHALYTPAQGWHEAVDDIEGAPKAYLNVLEDVRIERKVQDKYPGLRSSFQKAYKTLAEEDFFGVQQLENDYSGLLLIDRLNLKYKLGTYIDVQFVNSVERDFYERAYQTETFEDVVALAIEIYAYQKKLNELAEKQQEVDVNVSPSSGDGEEGEDQEDNSGDYEKNASSSSQDQDQGEGESNETGEKPNDSAEASDSDMSHLFGQKPDDIAKEELTSVEAAIKKAAKTPDIQDDDKGLEAITDHAFRMKEQELLLDDSILGETNVFTLNTIKQKNVVIDYKRYYSEWNTYLTSHDDYISDIIKTRQQELEDQFKKFKRDTEMAAAYMAKEFELRKAAYQYSRSSIQKTGVIDTNRLHTYKFSEDIFLKNTKLANYKNHGMMMFIDFSGSMQHNIGATIRQLLNLTTFCKMVQIPYEVYGFTTRVKYEEDEESSSRHEYESYADSEIIPQKFNLLNMLSSRMSRSEYNTAFKMLWDLSQAWDGRMTNYFINPWNHLHSTPLNTCIAYANDMIKNYKKVHNIEKMTVMFLTDGESDSFQVRMTDEGDLHRNTKAGRYYHRGRKAILRFAGKATIVKSINSGEVTAKMLQTIAKQHDVTMLGFFISQYRNEAVSKVLYANDALGLVTTNKEKYTNQLNKNRVIVEDNIFGYDRYFGLCAKYMDVVENEFGEMVEDGATKNKLKTAFSKMTKARRVNRILLNAFVDAIA